METLLPILLDYLPPEVVASFAGITVVMLVLTAIGKFLDAVIPFLREKAATTATDADDQAVDALARIAAILAFVNAWIPHTTIGTRKPEAGRLVANPTYRESARAPRRREGFVSVGLLIDFAWAAACAAFCIGAVAFLAGCNPSAFARAHTALDVTSTGVRGVEDVLTVAYVNPLHERCRRELEAGGTEEEWRECTRGAFIVGEVFAEARVAIFTAETGVNAAEQAEDESKLCQYVVPLGAVLPNAVAALRRAGIPIPEQVETYTPLIGQGVQMLCGVTP